jgi:hypothetical protein
MNKLQLIKTSLFALGLLSGSAIAAIQGSLGINSTGSLDINVDINDLVQVTNLDDLSLGIFNGGGADLSATDTFCIYRNGVGTFDITMSGSGAASAFTLIDGTNTVPYSVDFTNIPAAATTAMTTGALLGGQQNANTSSTTCSGVGDSDNVSVTVTVTSGNLASAPAGAYGGTLTMVVSPE